MSAEQRDKKPDAQIRQLGASIARRATRKSRATRRKEAGIWFGLGMFGLVGWSVAIPTLLGVAAGIWIDSSWPNQYSWTLMLLVIGLAIGCVQAWYWVNRERRNIEDDRDAG